MIKTNLTLGKTELNILAFALEALLEISPKMVERRAPSMSANGGEIVDHSPNPDLKKLQDLHAEIVAASEALDD